MKREEVKAVKQLLRDTFWQIDHLEDHELTPTLLRDFLSANIKKEVMTRYPLRERKTFWQSINSIVHAHLLETQK